MIPGMRWRMVADRFSKNAEKAERGRDERIQESKSGTDQ